MSAFESIPESGEVRSKWRHGWSSGYKNGGLALFAPASRLRARWTCARGKPRFSHPCASPRARCQLAGRACARDGALRSAMTVAGVALQGVGGCRGARAGAATRGRLRRVRRTSCSAAPCQLRRQPRLAIAFSARAVWLLTRTFWLRMASTRLTGTGVHTLGVARPGRSTARAALNCATAAIARRPCSTRADGA